MYDMNLLYTHRHIFRCHRQWNLCDTRGKCLPSLKICPLVPSPSNCLVCWSFWPLLNHIPYTWNTCSGCSVIPVTKKRKTSSRWELLWFEYNIHLILLLFILFFFGGGEHALTCACLCKHYHQCPPHSQVPSAASGCILLNCVTLYESFVLHLGM